MKEKTRLEVKGMSVANKKNKTTVRFELSNVKESIAKKIKKWCIDHKKTQGEWAEMSHNALINKD